MSYSSRKKLQFWKYGILFAVIAFISSLVSSTSKHSNILPQFGANSASADAAGPSPSPTPSDGDSCPTPSDCADGS